MARNSEITREEEMLTRLRLMAHRAFGAVVENRRGKGEEARKDLDALDWAIAIIQSKTAPRGTDGYTMTADRLPDGERICGGHR